MIEIRTERPEDFPAIRQLIVPIFHATYGTGEGEASLVDQLRELPGYDPTLSLVAVDGKAIVGHILFSRIEVCTPAGRIPALALAPLCVSESHRRQGIGGRLVRAGLQRGRAAGYAAAIVQGDPNYYGRFGFVSCASRGLVTPFPQPEHPANQVVSLDDERFEGLSGPVDYPAPWDRWKAPAK